MYQRAREFKTLINSLIAVSVYKGQEIPHRQINCHRKVIATLKASKRRPVNRYCPNRYHLSYQEHFVVRRATGPTVPTSELSDFSSEHQEDTPSQWSDYSSVERLWNPQSCPTSELSEVNVSGMPLSPRKRRCLNPEWR